MRRLIAVVLAAGASRRFGTDKRLAPLDNGRPVIAATLSAIAAANLDGVVIQRAGNCVPPALIPRKEGWSSVEIAAEIAERGIGASLAAAVRHLPADADLIICLADMPFMQPATYRVIAAALQPGRIVCPRHDGKRGNPVAFSNWFREELMLLEGDRGARDLLQKHADRVDFVDVDDAGIHRDIDWPEDLR